MVNLAEETEYAELKKRMEKEMFTRLLEEGDPRVFNRGDIFDRYPDVSGAKQFWNRMHSGEKVPFGWINASDFEPEGSGLEVN